MEFYQEVPEWPCYLIRKLTNEEAERNSKEQEKLEADEELFLVVTKIRGEDVIVPMLTDAQTPFDIRFLQAEMMLTAIHEGTAQPTRL